MLLMWYYGHGKPTMYDATQMHWKKKMFDMVELLVKAFV